MERLEELTWADFPDSDDELAQLACRTPGLVRVFRSRVDAAGQRAVQRRYFFAGYAALGDCGSVVLAFAIAVTHHLTRPA